MRGRVCAGGFAEGAIHAQTAWEALPILDEWRRLFPDEDPVAFHERWFTVRLTDPGGGAYTWDPAIGGTVSSTYGAPRVPLDGPWIPPQLERVTHLALGVTFEDHGLRARAELGRTP